MSDLELIVQESKSMLGMAQEIRVTSDEEYSQAGEFVMGCKALIKKIEEAHAPNIERWHKGHKEAIADRDQTLTPVKQALNIAGGVALEYKREQDRLAKEEAAVVERERRRQEEEARIREAERLEAQGKNEEAEQVISKPIEAPRPTRFETPVPKVAGLSTKKERKARIVEPNKVGRLWCMPDQTLVNMWIKNQLVYVKDPTPEQIKKWESDIGGVVIEQVETFAGRVK